MTPAAILDKLLPRWRTKLSPSYSPEYIDGFIQRNRPMLEAVVARAMMLRRIKRGDPPKTADEFAVYARIVARERPKDAEPDAAVVKRVLKRMDKMLARKGDPAGQEAAGAFGVEYAELRAEAILLRRAGWDAVPLLLSRPSLALFSAGSVVVVRDAQKSLHFLPGLEDSGEKIRADVAEVQRRVLQLRDGIADAARFDRYAMALWTRARAGGTSATPLREVETPPDLRDKSWRTEANLQAMRLVLSKEPGELTAEDLQALAQYSGWGGLSIDSVKKMLPPELVPESFGLIHEYYTPTAITESIAETLCPLLPELAGNDGIVRALEPSAGVGRLIRAFSPRRCLALEAGGQIKKIAWTAVEFSKVSSTLLRALRPDVDLYHLPFERWVRDEGSRYQGTFGLIVSNPPYGERGAMAREDPDEFYKEKRAFAYFMRRALDLLVPGGVGVFLIPAGFMSGNLNRNLREKLLRRHHLLGAFRLPSHDRKGRETVPGASVVMDVVFWRSRGGELTEIDEADDFILDGDYFKHHPDHVLGKEDGSFAGDDEAGMARSWRYKVTGDFKGLPPLEPRPVCTACVLTSIVQRDDVGTFQTVAREDDGIPADVDDDLRPALELGRRVGRYLAAVGADEADRAAQLWPELHTALRDFSASFGNPWRSKPLRELAEGRRKLAMAQQVLNAFEKTGSVVPALREAPVVAPKFSGQPDDVIAQAEGLYRQQRALTVAQLMSFHQRQGGTLSTEATLAALLAAGWNLDGDAWDQLLPSDAYLTGNDLWERHDRAVERAQRGDEQAKVQVRRLLEAIKPAVFDDLTDISPQHGYVPLDLVAGWMSATLNGRYGAIELERKGGFVQVRGHDYTAEDLPPMAPETLAFLGYYNHDPELFRPPQEKRERDAGPTTREDRAAKKQSLAERRMALAKKWDESFKAWIAADEARREQLVHAYNRIARGRVVPTFSPEPLDIVRWGSHAPKLKPHQIAGARRVLAQRGGLVAFDVGVGKTYTALAIIARARQEGWVRRPVILVPGSLVWKWHDDILCTLPDYRVVVIGSKRKRITRGVRKDVITSETDTPQERAKKWIALQTGQADVAVLSYDALARTKMNEGAVMAYVEQVEAVSRSIALRKRTLEEKTKNAKQRDKLTERERALLEHGVRAWVEEILALPSDWEYDPGVAWDELGIDMLVIDEAAAFKNLYKPQAREDGVPKFMGGGGEGSDRAWQVDFRAAAVRRQTGGAGIVLLTATPAKNSPLEFYNLIQFIDPAAFTRAGIRDPEQFIDRFLKIEYREVLDAAFDVTKRSAVTGFKNLDDLRTIIFTYGEFRTAAEVGLKLPRPLVETLTITMDEEQEAKYARYVAQIERILENPNPEGGESYAILGLLARLSLIALHASLEDGYSYKTALEGGTVQKRVYQDGEPVDVSVRLSRPTYESPKLTECAKRVAASPHCGHIIFCEPTAVHQWMREVLVKHGIPRERIAILNAEETAPADRIRIAREFNGLSSEPPAPGTCARPTDSAIAPKYDVVIANSVAYEGIDLQVRTCTIHHLDLPWTPADLEQRNGRAVRQGNTLGTVQIFYYFADGSTDGYRFSLIDGKAGWLGELIKSQVRDTNNPAAQQQLTPEDILLMISRNKEKTRALLEEKRKRQAEEARARIAKEAARLLRQAAGRFRDARTSADPERAARLRDEGEQRLADLEQVSPDAWPWAPWMYAVRDADMIIPENGGAPVYEGLRVARPRAGAPDQLDYLEFGQIVSTDEGDKIGLRAAGSPGWQLIAYTGTLNGTPIAARELPRDGGPLWPDDDDARTGAAIEKKIDEVFRYGRFESLRWRGASDTWLEKWWPRFETPITEGLARSHQREQVPVVDAEGLAIATGAELRGASIVPPTRAGWQGFLELAPSSGESFTNLKDIGLAWWGRKVPQDLLSKERNFLRRLIVPHLLDDPAYRNARENSDPQNARIENDKALGRVMLALFNEDPEAHGELYRRFSDDEAFRRSLHEQAFAETYSTSEKQRQGASGSEAAGPENVDQRVADLPPATTEETRPRAGQAAAKQLARRLRALLSGVKIGRFRYHTPHSEASGDEVEIDFVGESPDAPILTLRAAPRQGSEIDLRGELADEDGELVASFGWIAIELRDLIAMKETSFAHWFGMPVVAEPRLSPVMREALAALRAEEEAKPYDMYFWPGVHDATRDSLIARGLVEALENKKGGAPHFRTTAAGRAKLTEIGSPAAAPASAPPVSDSGQPYEEARSAIKALGLPIKKYAYYVTQAETAVASGKSYLPIVERARKTAEKLKGDSGHSKPRSRVVPQTTGSRQRLVDVVLDTFNASPRWRLAQLRTRPNGHVLVVYPEGRDPDAAVAAIDIIDENVDDVRWLDTRTPQAEQDTILERLDRALWAAFEVREEEATDEDENGQQKTAIPSPIQGLIDMMERRSLSLGARRDASKDTARTDGHQQIAEALRDLAEPAWLTADELERWLETERLMDAALVLRRSPDASPRELLARLWAEVLRELPLDEVKVVEPNDEVLVPEGVVFGDMRKEFVLERADDRGRASLRRIPIGMTVHLLVNSPMEHAEAERRRAFRPTVERADDERMLSFEHTGALDPRSLVHRRVRDARFITELYQKIGDFHDGLLRAPDTLRDVRVLLYWAAMMLGAPLCQGTAKARATVAFEQAKAYYDTARSRMIEGSTADAVRRMHEALRRISAAAAEIAKSCGEGQIDITVTPPHLPVRPEDKAAIEGGEGEVRP
ncbi:SNF2-related protein [Nannocystis bainbridge]|uniref:SNF2-related protein n=1 Tax=Nannocystis bainbridge TaxID=2995303 RepID=A0ABT5E793_9BACT|nr:SNF2-related protein [Nannocystis bainbridge]MDC0721729.1 SNF2-related protein [Nannocystis bainbridge]